MNLNRMFVTLAIFFATFVALTNFIPSDFYAHQTEIDITGFNPEVVDYFNAHNITVYNSQAICHTSGGVGWENKTIPSGLGSGDWIEIFWRNYLGLEFFQIKHAHDQWYGRSGHEFNFYHDHQFISHLPGGPSSAVSVATKADLVTYYDPDLNGTYFDLDCGHIISNILFQSTYPGVTIGDAYDNGTLSLSLTYELNPNGTSMNIWGIIGGLLTFQNPDFGIPGSVGVLVNGLMGGAMWACIILLAYAAITSILPTVPGWPGG